MQTISEAEALAYLDNVQNIVSSIETKVDEIWALDFTCPYFPKDDELMYTDEMRKWAETVEEIREHEQTSDDVYVLCDELLDLHEEYKKAVSVWCGC